MDYYAARDLLRTQEDPDVVRYGRYRASSSDDDGINVVLDDDTFESDDEYEQDVIESENAGNYDTSNPPTLPTQNIDILKKSISATKLAALSTTSFTGACITAAGFSVSVGDVEKCIRDHKDDDKPDLLSANTVSRSLSDDYPALITRVQLLQRALEKSATRNPRLTGYQDTIQQSTKVTMSALEVVVTAFSLNPKQESIFVRMGKKLLASLILPEQPEQQEVAFLGGHPGAGKSRVIAALQALAVKWGSAQAVATAAYQGEAAQVANGQTIHKLFGWYVNNRRQWAPTSEQKDRFSRLKLLILDEISTCDVSILGKIDSSLRKLLNRPNAVFGGVHVLLVGDWLQQLPVAGKPAFMSAHELLESRSRRQPSNSDYLDRLRGISAYQAVTSVAILSENMRHQHDPVWRSILDKWRVGNYDQKDIDLVNDLAYSKTRRLLQPRWSYFAQLLLRPMLLEWNSTPPPYDHFARKITSLYIVFQLHVVRPRDEYGRHC